MKRATSGTAAPERFWHKNRPPKERACSGACVRGMVLRRACKPLEVIVCACCGMKEVGALCGPGGGISALVFAAARGARRAAPHRPQPCNDITPTGAWREHATRGARGASLPWLGAPHAGYWPAPGAAAYNGNSPPPVYVRAASSTETGPRGART